MNAEALRETGGTMHAIVQDRYGPVDDVLRLREVAKPRLDDDEVLVRVRAASVHADVWHVVTGWPTVLRLFGGGVRRPKYPIPGTDFAGVIEAVGASVVDLRPGDAVFGESFAAMQWRNGGTFAEYVAVPQSLAARKPSHVTFEQAAAVPSAGIIALLNLQNGKRLQSARRVLVNGAAGGVGSIVVQLAKAYGAHVTGVDAAAKLGLVRLLGADEVIDYATDDFTRREAAYDLVFDVASTSSLAQCKRALTADGVYVLIGHDHYGAASGRVFGSLPRMMKLMLTAPFSKHLPKLELPMPTKQAALAVLAQMLERGKLTPVIDRTYALADVPEALRYLQTGKALGRIIITP